MLADLAAMLLSNITKHEQAVSPVILLKIQICSTPTMYLPQSRSATSPAPETIPPTGLELCQALPLLIDAFVTVAEDNTQAKANSLHFLASVFADLAQVYTSRSRT